MRSGGCGEIEGGAGTQEVVLFGAAEPLEAELLAQGIAPALDLQRPDELHRQARASVAGSLPGEVLGEAPRQVLRGAGVERAVAAAQQVDEGHS